MEADKSKIPPEEQTQNSTMAKSDLKEPANEALKTGDDAKPNEDEFLSIIRCDICNVPFSGLASYEQHLEGRKHTKKVKYLMMLKENKLKASSQDSEEGSEIPDDIYCEICQKTCSGYIPYELHLKGSGHAKHLKKEKLKQTLKDLPEIQDANSKTEDINDNAIPKPYAYCPACQKAFSGPEPFQQHLQCSSHKKKLQLSDMLKNLQKEDPNSDLAKEDAFSRCEVCDKSFSGFFPYQQHMISSVHEKQVKKSDLIAKMKIFAANGTESNIAMKYVCKECKKSFIDPVAFKLHLESSNDHVKQKARSTILKMLARQFPEIVVVKSFVENSTSNVKIEVDHDEANNCDFLSCQICNLSFSGPENAWAHAQSRKHLRATEQARKIKLIKDGRPRENGKLKDVDKTEELLSNINHDDLRGSSTKKITDDSGIKNQPIIKKLEQNGVADSLHDEFEFI